MVSKALFHIDDKEYKILSCSIHFFQETDDSGRRTSITKGGQITLTVETQDDDKLARWVINGFESKNGKLKFHKTDAEMSIMKQIDFEDGYLIGYDEIYDSAISPNMKTTITISAKKIMIGRAIHENNWSV
jgi:hypothetical protein